MSKSVHKRGESGSESHKSTKAVLAGIPAYNEEATIGSVVLVASRYADQVVVADDGSSDATVPLARQAGAIVLDQRENDGKGAAVQRLFAFAREHGVDRLVLLDADWQHDPEEIPALLETLDTQEADVVIGSRYLDGDPGETPVYRRIGQRILDTLSTASTGTPVTDSQSGYRVFDRAAIEELQFDDDGFGIETEMLRSASEQGLSVAEAPISVNYDVPDANTSSSILHGIHVVDTVLSIVRDRHPLLFFGIPGLVLTVAGLLYGAWTVSLYQAGQGFYVGKALLSSVLFLVGIFSIYSALIMNMVGHQLRDLQ